MHNNEKTIQKQTSVVPAVQTEQARLGEPLETAGKTTGKRS